MDYYPCFMISKTLLDEGKWKDDEQLRVNFEEGCDEDFFESTAVAKMEMGSFEWSVFKYLLGSFYGDQPAFDGPKVRTLVRAVIRSYEDTVETAKRAPFTILFNQGDSYGRLTVYWTPNFREGTPSYTSTETPEYLWIETEDAKVAWKNA